MPSPHDAPRLRRALHCELERLQQIERAASSRFEEVGLPSVGGAPACPLDELGQAASRGTLWVLADEADAPFGFAWADEAEDGLHLVELNVHSDYQRRGYGRRLLEHVCAWGARQGHRRVTLTTFRDVPFNAPWYARCGFEVLDDATLGPRLAELRRFERRREVAPRVAMARALDAAPHEEVADGDIARFNRAAWDGLVVAGNVWTRPVDGEAIAAARAGQPRLVLTPNLPIPARWLGQLRGARVLCLASGGGQQGPILAAAGAQVTVYDNSPSQLAQDAAVAAREGLALETIQGDMRDLGAFDERVFDLIVHPVSNCFVPDIRPVWRECFRVLREGGALLAGLANPVVWCFDPDLEAQGTLQLRYAVPYSDIQSLDAGWRRRYREAGDPLHFGHGLTDLIGAQLDAGFVLAGLYEDCGRPGSPLNAFFPGYFATRALRLA